VKPNTDFAVCGDFSFMTADGESQGRRKGPGSMTAASGPVSTTKDF